MQICCDGDLYPKNRFQCCAGAVKPREEGGIRCCNHVGGSGPSSGPKYPMTEYQPLDGEKCCIGLNSFGKNFLSKHFGSTQSHFMVLFGKNIHTFWMILMFCFFSPQVSSFSWKDEDCGTKSTSSGSSGGLKYLNILLMGKKTNVRI